MVEAVPSRSVTVTIYHGQTPLLSPYHDEQLNVGDVWVSVLPP